jgi:hypothetical protein
MTPDTIQKLKDAFSIDATVEEACVYAKISKQTFYNWKEAHQDLFDELDALRLTPVLAMRQSAVTLGTASYSSAMDYLSRKRPEEFGNRSKVEHAGKIDMQGGYQTEAQKKVAIEYEQKLKEAITLEAKAKQP